MSTPTLPTLRTEADQLLRLTAMSPVSQILAVALGQANNGTQPDPDATTNSLLEGIRTWPNQAPSDVEAIVVNQVMRLLAKLVTLRSATAPLTQVIAVGDSLSVDVTVAGATAGDFVFVTPRTPVLGDYLATGQCVSDGTVNVLIRNMSSILGVNLSNNVFNIGVLKY